MDDAEACDLYPAPSPSRSVMRARNTAAAGISRARRDDDEGGLRGARGLTLVASTPSMEMTGSLPSAALAGAHLEKRGSRD